METNIHFVSLSCYFVKLDILENFMHSKFSTFAFAAFPSLNLNFIRFQRLTPCSIQYKGSLSWTKNTELKTGTANRGLHRHYKRKYVGENRWLQLLKSAMHRAN